MRIARTLWNRQVSMDRIPDQVVGLDPVGFGPVPTARSLRLSLDKLMVS